MYEGQQISGGFGYSNMSFGEKVSASIALTKRHGLSIFLTMVVIWLVLIVFSFVGSMIFGGAIMMMAGGGYSSGSQFPIGAILGMIVFYLAYCLLSFYFMIGVFSLILKYVDGVPPEGGIVNQVLSPWHNFFPLLLCVIVWMVLIFVFSFILGILNIIPILGFLIMIAGMFILSMVMTCAIMFMSDKLRPGIAEAITTPIMVVKDNFLKWLVAVVVSGVVYLPGIIVMGVVMALAGSSTAVMILGWLLAMVYFAAASIFVFVFFAVTYRQTYGGGLDSVVDQVF